MGAEYINRDPRFIVIDGDSVGVTVEASEYDEAVVHLTLLDVSECGAKFQASERLPQGQQLALKIESESLGGGIQVDASVCWCQLDGSGEWIAGCSFEPQIPCETLDRLARGGVVDRRVDERRSIALNSTAAWELASETEPVQIVNLSSRGFCLASCQGGRPGARVRLCFGDGYDEQVVTGRCRWQVDSEEGFTLGCEFSSPEDYAILRRVKDRVDASGRKRGILGRIFG